MKLVSEDHSYVVGKLVAEASRYRLYLCTQEDTGRGRFEITSSSRSLSFFRDSNWLKNSAFSATCFGQNLAAVAGSERSSTAGGTETMLFSFSFFGSKFSMVIYYRILYFELFFKKPKYISNN